MKNTFILLVSIVLLASCATQPKTALEKVKEVPVAETANDWYLFENEELDYSIQFPKAPTFMPLTVDTEMGKLNTKLYICEVTGTGKESGIYAVGVADYPFGAIHSNKTEMLDDFFRGSIDGAVENLKGKLLSETKIDMDGFEGRAVKADAGGGQIMMMNTYLVGNRIYTLQVMSESIKDKSLYANWFFDSFKVSEAYKVAARKEVVTAETAAGWQLYESKAGGYKIAFPKTPIESTNAVDSDMGELNMYSATCDADTDNMMYMSVYIDYPDSLVNAETTNLEEFYKNVIDGAVGGANGKLAYVKNVKLGDVEGREAKISFEHPDVSGVAMVRVFLIANRMYMIQTVTEAKKDANDSMNRFMDSFELTK